MTNNVDSPNTTSTPSSDGQRRHEHAHCESCTLNVPESRYCGSFGPADARIVVIGEAPGFSEASKGEPFVGPSGKLLDAVLAEYGLHRSELRITNAVLCRPPNNRTPTRSEVQACWPRLEQELRDGHPDTIVTLGNTSSQVVLRTTQGITSLRVGPAKRTDRFPDARVVPTVHPAYCLRNAGAFPDFVTDLGKINSVVRDTWGPPQFKVFDDAVAATALRQLPGKSTTLVVDVETGSDKDEVDEWSGRKKCICIGFGYAPGRVAIIGEKALQLPEVNEALKWLLTQVKFVAHNGKFDMAVLSQWGDGELAFDTMLASYVLDERKGTHSLDWLSQELLGSPDWKSEMEPYKDREKGFENAPRDKLYKYNAYDVSNTFALWRHFEENMDANDRKVHELLVKASWMLMHAEFDGIGVDVDVNAKMMEEYEVRLEQLREQLSEWVGNPNSPLQVKAALAELGVKVAGTDKAILYDLLLKTKDVNVKRFLTLMLEHRKEAKFYGTYVKGIRLRLFRNRIHPTFLLHGTSTGRLACRNPNLQNIPRGSTIRCQFVPAEGNVFVQADYSTAELRVVAVEAEDPYLISLFQEGRDIHSEVAERFYGPGFTKEQRVRAKAVVFGLTYGREAYSLAQEFKISPREAQTYLNEFFQMIPRTVAWKKWIKDVVFKQQGDLTTRFGRKHRVWLITKDNARDIEKESYAFIPQSTASDLNLASAVRLRKDHGLRVIVPVHDSLLVECDAAAASLVAETMQRVMSETAAQVYSDIVPWPVEAKVGSNWGEV